MRMADMKVYTLDEVAGILRVTKRTMYNYINAGSLRAVKMGKYWRVTEDNLRAFLDSDSPSPRRV